MRVISSRVGPPYLDAPRDEARGPRRAWKLLLCGAGLLLALAGLAVGASDALAAPRPGLHGSIGAAGHLATHHAGTTPRASTRTFRLAR